MTDDTKHTPTPWRHCSCGKCGLIWSLVADCIVADANVHGEGYEPHPVHDERQANAAFICRAVNSHDALVKACEDALLKIEANQSENCDDDCGWCAIAEQLRAALAEVKR